MLAKDRFVVYGGTGNHGFDASVLRVVNSVTGLGLEFSHCWHSVWPDGEPGFRIGNPGMIHSRHALVFACPVNYKLASELGDLITACKHQYGARSVIAILSFLRYRRQDHDDFEHEITRLRWFIRDLKNWGADQLVVCDPHSEGHTRKYCNEFGIKLRVCDPTAVFADAIKGVIQAIGGSPRARIYSPDFGSVARAIALAKLLGLTVLATPKRRTNSRVEMVQDGEFLKDVWARFGDDAPVSCEVQDLGGLHLFMREDEVDSGSTAVTTARALSSAGAGSVNLVATHPVCSRGWKIRFFPVGEAQPFRQIWLGNTRPRGDGETAYEGSTGGQVRGVDVSPCVAGALAEVLSNIQD